MPDMMAYKLTDIEGHTRQSIAVETLWSVGTTVYPPGTVGLPYDPNLIYAGLTPEICILLSEKWGRASRLFHIEAVQPWQTDGLTRWTAGRVHVLEELPLPTVRPEEMVAWMLIHCPHQSTRDWAIKWLSGEDRSKEAAQLAVAAGEMAGNSGLAAKKAACSALNYGWIKDVEREGKKWSDQHQRGSRIGKITISTLLLLIAGLMIWIDAWPIIAVLLFLYYLLYGSDTALLIGPTPGEVAYSQGQGVRVKKFLARLARSAKNAAETEADEAKLSVSLNRARAILAGQWPAERAWDDLEVPNV